MAFSRDAESLRPWWASPFVLIGLALAVGLLSYSSFRVVRREIQVRREGEELTRRIHAMRQENAELREIIEHGSSPAMIERLAKERMNLKLAGEAVVVVEHAKPVPREEPAPPGRVAAFFMSLGGLFGEVASFLTR